MKIKEFAESRGVRPNTISVYIKSHPEMFEGHITSVGKYSELDEEAVRILEEKYPVTPPAVLVPDPEVQERLDAAQIEIMRLQRKLEALQDELKIKTEAAALAEARQILIEQKDNQIQQEQERATAAEAKVEKVTEDLRNADQRAAEAEATARAAEDQAEEQKRRADQAEEARAEAEKRAEEKAAEVEQLRNRGLWARILNK